MGNRGGKPDCLGSSEVYPAIRMTLGERCQFRKNPHSMRVLDGRKVPDWVEFGLREHTSCTRKQNVTGAETLSQNPSFLDRPIWRSS